MIFCWEDHPVQIKPACILASIQSRGGSVDTSPRQRHRHPAPHHWAWPSALCLCCFKNFRLVSPASLPLVSDRSVPLCQKSSPPLAPARFSYAEGYYCLMVAQRRQFSKSAELDINITPHCRNVHVENNCNSQKSHGTVYENHLLYCKLHKMSV